MPFISTFPRHEITQNREGKKQTLNDIQTKWLINKKRRNANKSNICKNIKSH